MRIHLGPFVPLGLRAQADDARDVYSFESGQAITIRVLYFKNILPGCSFERPIPMFTVIKIIYIYIIIKNNE